MFRLENIHYLYAYLLIPVFILLFVLMKQWRKKAIRSLGDPAVVKQLMPDVSTNKSGVKFIILLFVLALIILGIVNPQIGSKLQEVKRNGADVMIALDVSNSMKAEDLSPNRLERAKQAISRLVDKLEGDRLGIVVFGGEAYVQLPITTDYAAAKLFLETIDTDIIPTQGTAIGAAIRLSMESFGQDMGKNKAIIVITDGENHEDDALEAAKEAVEKGISVNTIGMGSPNGSPIPVYKNGTQTGFKKDKDGNTVITKLNEQMLEEIAGAGNGVYVHATNSETGLNAILDEVNKLEKKNFESKMYSDYDDKFYYFLIPALFLIIIELFINERKSKWIRQLNLFDTKK
jgi:Ca-activated chloride channel family protein